MTKKLVIFCDGTWNEPTQHRTNVLKMLQATEFTDEKGEPQIVHYIAGIGTRKGESFRGGVFGLGISENIMHAYSFIMSNYEPCDEIFLFGFSRGAFTARSIAGLIHNLGVLKRHNLPLVAEAYAHYKDRDPAWKPNGAGARKFREDNCHVWPANIKFLGVWDTVGALGAPYGIMTGYLFDKIFKTSFHSVELSESVGSAYHALAADERRWLFRPTPVALTDYHRDRNRANLDRFGFPLYAQKWFPGVHSNVGGGYDRHGLSDIALEWMAENARKNGLNIKPLEEVQLAPGRGFQKDLTEPVENSQTFYYQLAALLVKVPSLMGLAPVYPTADSPLTKHITWAGHYVRPIDAGEDMSLVDEKKAVDTNYKESRLN